MYFGRYIDDLWCISVEFGVFRWNSVYFGGIRCISVFTLTDEIHIHFCPVRHELSGVILKSKKEVQSEVKDDGKKPVV